MTAELAVALPAVTIALAAVLAMGQAGLAQVACVDAARAGARAAARGDDVDAVRRLAVEGSRSGTGDVRDGPRSSAVVTQDGDLVRVRVSRTLRLLLPFGPRVEVSATAVSQSEQPAERPGGSSGVTPGDEGSATVLVLGVCLVALVLVTALGALSSAVVARHRAQAAADLGALAAADVLVGRAGGDPCTAAVRVVGAQQAELVACQVGGGDDRDSGEDVVVTVRCPVPGQVGRWGPARARARAGRPAMSGVGPVTGRAAGG